MVILSKKTKRNFTQSRATTNFFSCGSGITACIDYLAYTKSLVLPIKGSL
jgi:3-mercaptopyruvate sulfurtransferase SseA